MTSYLPSIDLAIIDIRKLTNYLLDMHHPDGGSKAVFLMRFGFTDAMFTELADALLNHAKRYAVQRSLSTQHGLRYVIEGPIETPDKRNPIVRTIWIVRDDEIAPRFVTLVPIRGVNP